GLAGFNTFVNNSVQVNSGSSTPLAMKLAVAGTAETVDVTAASPIIDMKRETTTTNVTLEELQNIPSARDPWAVMQTVPTVYMDRVNVGGSESGQQSNYNAKGARDTDNTWSIGGVPVTMVLKKGVNTPHGNLRTYFENETLQSVNISPSLAEALGNTTGKGN